MLLWRVARVIGLSVLLVAAATLLSPARAQGAKRHVRIGVFQNPPLVVYDPATGRASGIFSVILARAATDQGWELDYVPGTFSESLERLKRGQIDLLPSVPYTTAQENGLAFNADPVVTSWGRVFVRRGSDIAAIPDLAGKTVAVLHSSLLSDYVTEATLRYGTAARLQEWPTYEAAFEAVAQRRADAVLANRFSGAFQARRVGLQATSVVLAPYGFRIAASKTADPALLKGVDRVLRELKADATSDYYGALTQLDEITIESTIPTWVKVGAGAGAVLLVVCIGWAVWARRSARKMLALATRLAASEQQQRRANDELQRIADNCLDVIAVLDRDFRIVRVSSACRGLWGFAPEELVGKSAFALLRANDAGVARSALEQVRVGQPLHSQEARVVRRDGSTARMLWSLVWSEQDEELYAIGRDDTERHRLIQQLQLANRDLRTYAQSVSHDLRGPVAAVVGFVGAALRDDGHLLGERSRARLQRAHRAGQRLDAIIANLLRLAQLTEIGVHRRACDVTALCHDIAAALVHAHPGRQVALDIRPGMKAHADGELLRHVFENLLSNAWKFTRETECATITVGWEEGAAEPVFFVADNGAGFDMAHADRLFAPFTRLHDQDRYEGSGIGLSIAQRVISGHGGKIWARSAVGEGATFFFTLGQAAGTAGAARDDLARAGARAPATSPSRDTAAMVQAAADGAQVR